MIRLALLLVILQAPPPFSGGDVMPDLTSMTRYQFGLLRKGPSWTAERSARTDSIQALHLANIQRMAKEGYLLAAGPLLDNGDLRGVFIFRGDSVAALRRQVARDPAVATGRLALDLYSWLAPAGIGVPYQKLAREPGHRDSMVTRTLVLFRRGPRAPRGEDGGAARSVKAAHLNMLLGALASGDLASAGPFQDGGELEGVMVVPGDSTAARRIIAMDGAVRAQHLVPELHPWWAAWGTMPGDTTRVE